MKKRHPNFIDRTGHFYGMWYVLGEDTARNSARYGTYWVCECECGIVASVRNDHLSRGESTGCGCVTNGGRSRGREDKSCAHHHELHATWRTMADRCFNPNVKAYAGYGALGVTMCDRWRHSFFDFLADVGERPDASMTLDRINPFGDYEPTNVRWATREQQQANKRVNYPPVLAGLNMFWRMNAYDVRAKV